ncbi:hypothetical protein Y032_0162g3410 [Ancylostoma ceylanicum]|uniref:Uncharacterized protein n=1 Tax=Ancylostoma ceylanicum TaxID=53326 RepID=A0A016SWW4_9BILA|nr:hypothetical protein Y032_0162g3410 [Ancylostoma ceylanicum]
MVLNYRWGHVLSAKPSSSNCKTGAILLEEGGIWFKCALIASRLQSDSTCYAPSTIDVHQNQCGSLAATDRSMLLEEYSCSLMR